MSKIEKTSDILSYSELFENKKILVRKDGIITAIYKVISPDLETSIASETDIAYRFTEFINTLPNKTIIHSDFQRVINKDIYVTSDELSGADKDFDDDRKEHFSREKNYKNVLFISISIKSEITDKGIADISIDELEKICDDFEISLSSFNYKFERLYSDTLITYLSKKINLIDYDITCPDITYGLSEFLTLEPMEFLKYPFKIGDNYCNVLNIKTWPNQHFPQLLKQLQTCNFPLSFTTRLITYDNEKSYSEVDKKRNRLYTRRISGRQTLAGLFSKEPIDNPENYDQRAVQGAEEASDLLDDIVSNNATIGNVTSSILIWSKDIDKLESRINKIKTIFTRFSYGLINETHGAFSAFLGSLPGEPYYNFRSVFLTSKSWVDLLILSTPYQGFKVNPKLKEWTGTSAPHIIARNSLDKSIYYLNLNGKSDVGHTVVVGGTGGGKSILLSTLASQFSKYKDSRVIFFDIFESSLPMIKKNKGTIYKPASYSSDLCFQPLYNAKDNLSLCIDFIHSICEVQGVDFTAVERDEVTKALMQLPKHQETLTVLHALIQSIALEDENGNSSKVALALSAYIKEGAYGQLFDSQSDKLNDETWPNKLMFEMSSLLDEGEAVAIPAMVYIFGKLERRLNDNKPTLLILDEAWRYLNNELFREYIMKWLKTMRKKRVFVVMATQSLEDLNADSLRIITECHSKIFLANREAMNLSYADKYSKWGVPGHMIDKISLMKPKKEYAIIQDEGNVIFDLELTSKQLDLLTNKEA